MHTGDIVIHIDEALDDDRVHDLARQIGDGHGIFSACMHEQNETRWWRTSIQTTHSACS